MEFGLAVKFSVEIASKSNIVNSLSDSMEAYFKNRQYGSDIKAYTIGIVCVSAQFDQFYKKDPKPKYTKGKKVINPDGIPFTLEDNFEYSIKIDFEAFKNAEEEGARAILAREILSSLVLFEKVKSRIKDFDMTSFKVDLEDYFKSQKLI